MKTNPPTTGATTGQNAQGTAAIQKRIHEETYLANDPARWVPDFEYVSAKFATELGDQLTAAHAQIDLLKAEVDRLKTERLGMVATRVGARAAVIELHDELIAAKEEIATLKSDVSREVTLLDEALKQRIPINDAQAREFVLVSLSRHTLLSKTERQDCADQILTAFEPIAEERDRLQARVEEAEKARDKYWEQLCETVEALGKVSPEAAPYSVQWAKEIRAELAALREDKGRLIKEIDCAANALTDSILCSGNDAATNIYFVNKLRGLTARTAHAT